MLDPANLFETEPAEEKRRIIADAVDLLGDRIVMAHAKDRAADGSVRHRRQGRRSTIRTISAA